MAKLTVSIEGMHCASCVGRVEKALLGLEGVHQASVNFSLEKAYVEYDPSLCDLAQMEKAVNALGYQARGQDKEAAYEKAKRSALMALVMALPLLIVAMGPMVGLPRLPFDALIQWCLATPLLWVGRHFFIQGFGTLLKGNGADMDTLVALGVGSAYVYSTFLALTHPGGHLYFETAGLLIAFILLGRWMEARAKGRTSAAIEALMKLEPQTAWKKQEGEWIQVALPDISEGDLLLVKPGGKVPVDGLVLEGSSQLDESLLTGESLPVAKTEGDEVLAGTLNGTGALQIKASRIGEETFLQQIVRLVEEAQASKPPVQRLVDQVAAIFVPAVMAIALVSAGIWLAVGAGWPFALQTFVAVLIIACPCALGLATPTAIAVGTGVGAKLGVLIKNADALQLGERVDTVIFDKTGTLTQGKLALAGLHSLEDDDETLLRLASAVEQHSEHPLATPVSKAVEERHLSPLSSSQFEATPGKGATALVDGQWVSVGSLEWLEAEAYPPFMEKGWTTVAVKQGERLVGYLGLADTLRPEATKVVKTLRESGKRVLMITGDHRDTAQAIAKEAGISEVLSQVLPGDKAAKLKSLQDEGGVVAMVGDGINDAAALAQADLGIAIGSGTDAAREAGAIVILQGDLNKVLIALRLSKAMMRKIRQNLFWAFAYNTAAIPLAAGLLFPFTGWLLHPVVAGAAMAFSSVSVVLNSLSLNAFFRKT